MHKKHTLLVLQHSLPFSRLKIYSSNRRLLSFLILFSISHLIPMVMRLIALWQLFSLAICQMSHAMLLEELVVTPCWLCVWEWIKCTQLFVPSLPNSQHDCTPLLGTSGKGWYRCVINSNQCWCTVFVFWEQVENNLPNVKEEVQSRNVRWKKLGTLLQFYGLFYVFIIYNCTF